MPGPFNIGSLTRQLFRQAGTRRAFVYPRNSASLYRSRFVQKTPPFQTNQARPYSTSKPTGSSKNIATHSKPTRPKLEVAKDIATITAAFTGAYLGLSAFNEQTEIYKEQIWTYAGKPESTLETLENELDGLEQLYYLGSLDRCEEQLINLRERTIKLRQCVPVDNKNNVKLRAVIFNMKRQRDVASQFDKKIFKIDQLLTAIQQTKKYVEKWKPSWLDTTISRSGRSQRTTPTYNLKYAILEGNLPEVIASLVMNGSVTDRNESGWIHWGFNEGLSRLLVFPKSLGARHDYRIFNRSALQLATKTGASKDIVNALLLNLRASRSYNDFIKELKTCDVNNRNAFYYAKKFTHLKPLFDRKALRKKYG